VFSAKAVVIDLDVVEVSSSDDELPPAHGADLESSKRRRIPVIDLVEWDPVGNGSVSDSLVERSNTSNSYSARSIVEVFSEQEDNELGSDHDNEFEDQLVCV